LPGDDSIRVAARRATLAGLERPRSVSMRLGIPVNASPQLFLDRASGFYVEFSYASHPGFLRFGKGGGRFDGGIEVVLALQSSTVVGGMLAFDGPACVFGLVNGTLTLTPWEYSGTAFNLTLVAGGGIQSLRWNLNRGDLDYTGTEPYRQSAPRPVLDTGFKLQWSIWLIRNMQFDVVGRWVVGLDTVETFRTLPLARFADGGGPVGKLGGKVLMAGVSLNF
jgi:hypothetical protein